MRRHAQSQKTLQLAAIPFKLQYFVDRVGSHISENTLYEASNIGACRLSLCPIHSHISFNCLHHLISNCPQSAFAHQIARAVLGQCVAECDFFVTKASFFSSFLGRTNICGERNEFFQNLRRRKRVSVISRNRGL